MSGPPIPRPTPAPGSNAIGKFAIGVSPIGTISPFDWWATVISQYANSPIITGLIANMFSYIDQTADFDSFFDNMWNADTAVGYGLDVIGRKVGVARILQVAAADYFGFIGPGGASGQPFGIQSFFSGQTLTNNFALADPSYRTLIFAKALANITDGSIRSLNQLLLNLFPKRGNCFVTDGQNMTMTYTFTFPLTQVELSIIGQSGALPRPTGVQATVVHP